MERKLSPLFTWRSAVASAESGLPSSARLVALVLSLHMNERGGSAFPSLATLALETGLGRRTVIRALRLLREEGWLDLVRRGGPTKGMEGGRASEYQAAVPRWCHGDTTPGGGGVTDGTEVVSGATRGSVTVAPQDVHEDVQEGVRVRKRTSKRTKDGKAGGALLAAYVAEHGWPTGSRWTHAGASGSYVADPLGHDRPSYDVPWGRPSKDEIVAALRRAT